MLYRVVKLIATALARLLFRVEAAGRGHIPRSGPTLIVSNHSSVLDPPIMAVVTPRPLHFLAKAELFSIPLFGRLISGLHSLPVRREGTDPGALRTALRLLTAGQALLVFPEGTRGEEGTLREGKAGAGMLAVRSGAPVVPAYIEGTGRVLARGRWAPRLEKIRVTFGPTLCFAGDGGLPRKARYREASREMMAAIARVKAQAGKRRGTPHLEPPDAAVLTKDSTSAPPATSTGGSYQRR